MSGQDDKSLADSGPRTTSAAEHSASVSDGRESQTQGAVRPRDENDHVAEKEFAKQDAASTGQQSTNDDKEDKDKIPANAGQPQSQLRRDDSGTTTRQSSIVHDPAQGDRTAAASGVAPSQGAPSIKHDIATDLQQVDSTSGNDDARKQSGDMESSAEPKKATPSDSTTSVANVASATAQSQSEIKPDTEMTPVDQTTTSKSATASNVSSLPARAENQPTDQAVTSHAPVDSSAVADNTVGEMAKSQQSATPELEHSERTLVMSTTQESRSEPNPISTSVLKFPAAFSGTSSDFDGNRNTSATDATSGSVVGSDLARSQVAHQAKNLESSEKSAAPVGVPTIEQDGNATVARATERGASSLAETASTLVSTTASAVGDQKAFDASRTVSAVNSAPASSGAAPPSEVASQLPTTGLSIATQAVSESAGMIRTVSQSSAPAFELSRIPSGPGSGTFQSSALPTAMPIAPAGAAPSTTSSFAGHASAPPQFDPKISALYANNSSFSASAVSGADQMSSFEGIQPTYHPMSAQTLPVAQADARNASAKVLHVPLAPHVGVTGRVAIDTSTKLETLRKEARKLGEEHYNRGPGRKRPLPVAGDGSPALSKKDKKSQSAYISRFAAKEYEKLLEDAVAAADASLDLLRSQNKMCRQDNSDMREQIAALEAAIRGGLASMRLRLAVGLPHGATRRRFAVNEREKADSESVSSPSKDNTGKSAHTEKPSTETPNVASTEKKESSVAEEAKEGKSETMSLDVDNSSKDHGQHEDSSKARSDSGQMVNNGSKSSDSAVAADASPDTAHAT